ncbi:MAG: sensor domain-containing diguanylate cyclase [Culicoidibacterales bacterium]
MELLKSHKGMMELVKQAPVNLLFKDLEARYVLASNVCSHFSDVDLIGKTDMDIQPDPELGKLFYEEDLRVMAEKKPYKYTQEMRFGDDVFHYEISRTPLFGETGEVVGMVGTVTDVTELVNLREFYREMSFQDQLTGAYNRRYLQENYFDQEATLTNHAVIMCDCNNLKKINDQYGHKFGDELIKLISQVLIKQITDFGEVMRIGGDEFIMVLPEATAQQCETIITKLKHKLTTYEVAGQPVSAAFGFALQSHAQTFDEVMSRADQMMYQDKQQQKAQG